MPIYPTEASWVLSTSASPDPLYKDKNITVYGIPILPCSETPRNTSSTSGSSIYIDSPAQILKRKRDPSPDPPSKRLALVAEEIQPGQSQSLDQIMQQAGFAPAGLAGETAQEWRRLMVDVMFPGVKANMEKQKPRKERDRDSAPSRSKKSGDNNADVSAASNEHSSKSTKTEAQIRDNNGPTPLNGSASEPPSNVSIELPSEILWY
jgi:ribonuclease Z